MVLTRVRLILLQHSKRKYGTKVKPKIEANQCVLANIKDEVYTPKQHPGIIKPKTVPLPLPIVHAIENLIQDYPIKLLYTNSAALSRHLKGRVPPMEENDMTNTKQKILDRVLLREKRSNTSNQIDESQFKQRIKDKVEQLLKEKIYNWSPLNYNVYNSLLYLFSRSAPEYAVLTKIFSEITTRDVNFKPRSIFDFGSGVGTVTWAAREYWKDCIYENFNVDISGDMNDLAQMILQGGHNTKIENLKGVFYRQFLPASNNAYDLVVSAYSMLELPSFQARMDVILKLWNKTSKYLVIVEQGTNAGFKVINEIRDFIILNLKDNKNSVHVFSPCPHDSPCPRFLTDNTPCNFEVGYNKPFGAVTDVEYERYSYVVLKRGIRDDIDAEWPRIVRETLVRSKHVICRTCTAHGKLQELIFTASKHGKPMYHCARASKWGDRLPISLKDSNETDIQ